MEVTDVMGDVIDIPTLKKRDGFYFVETMDDLHLLVISLGFQSLESFVHHTKCRAELAINRWWKPIYGVHLLEWET